MIPINQELKNNSNSSESSGGKPRIVLVKIENFKIKPNNIRLKRFERVKFLIGENKSEIYSEVYHEKEKRFFVLNISGYNAESELLYEGHSFVHTFDRVGTFLAKCVINKQI